MSQKNYVTNDYILNKQLLDSTCNPSKKKVIHNQPACGCGPMIGYTCVMSTNKCWDKQQRANETNNQIVANNIAKGGLVCDFRPRSNINNRMCGRYLTNPVRPPYEYNDVIETEFYLIHGENSKCSKFWKSRHNNR